MKISIHSGPVKILSDTYPNAEVLGELNKGEYARLLKTFYRSGDRWDKIKTEDGKKGYLLNTNVFKIENAYINQSRVFVYEKTSERSTIINMMEKAERFKILDKMGSNESGWLFIEDDFGDRGYISQSIIYEVFKSRLDWFLGEASTFKNKSGFYGVLAGVLISNWINKAFDVYNNYSGTTYLWIIGIPFIIPSLIFGKLYDLRSKKGGNKKFIKTTWSRTKIIFFVRLIPSIVLATVIDHLFNMEKHLTKPIHLSVSLLIIAIFYFIIYLFVEKQTLKLKGENKL